MVLTSFWTRVGWFLLVALLLAIGAVLFIREEEEWNRPKIEDLTIVDSDMADSSLPLHVTITCKCPPVFIENQRQEIQLSVWVGSADKLGTSSMPPSVEEPQKSPRQAQLSALANLAGDSRDLYLFPDSANPAIEIPNNQTATVYLGPIKNLPVGIRHNFPAAVTVKPGGPLGVNIRFQPLVPGATIVSADIGAVTWFPQSRPLFLKAIAPYLYGGTVLICAFGVFLLVDSRNRRIQAAAAARLQEAKEKAVSNPGQAQYAWEIARIKLEAYFDRNLIQVNLVFWVAVLVMAVGFGFVLAGVALCFRTPEKIGAPLVAAVSGIVTQFIGATVMVIYRSTMAQANSFMLVLEGINAVDMAMQVLDRIPETDADLKNQTRAEIIPLLLHPRHTTTTTPGGATRPSPRKQRPIQVATGDRHADI